MTFQIRSIDQFEKKFGVKITVEKGSRVNRIRIQGTTKDAMEAEAKLVNVLHSKQVEDQLQQEAQQLVKYVSILDKF